NGVDDLVYRVVLAENYLLDVIAKRAEPQFFIREYGLWRDLCHSRDRIFDHLHGHLFWPPARRQKLYRSTDLIDNVDRFIGQKAVIDIFAGQLGRGAERFIAVPDA